jgi:hypothetical protein
MTSKEAMKIIEQRHLTTPEAYEVVHALFEAERREAALEKLCDDATQLDGERECWLSERSVRDVLSPPSSWPTNEAESEALRQERGMAQVRESASPPPTEPGLREAVREEIDGLMDNARHDCATNRAVAVDRILDAALRASPSEPSEGVREALEKIVVRMNIVTARWRHQKAVNKGEMDALCNMQIDAENALRNPEPPQGAGA